MPDPRVYDVMYRARLASMFWSRADRAEIRALVEGGPCDPSRRFEPGGRRPRAIDLGCGAGGVSVYLARQGFDTTGVDFSSAALELARREVTQAGLDDNPRFVQADLRAGSIPGVEGPFDLLVDYGTLDDLRGQDRPAIARLVASLARPGSCFFLYTFYGHRSELPRFSMNGPSRLAPELVEPSELETLFADEWDIELLQRDGFVASFLLTKR